MGLYLYDIPCRATSVQLSGTEEDGAAPHNIMIGRLDPVTALQSIVAGR